MQRTHLCRSLVIAVSLSSAALACRPSPTSKEIEEVPEGRRCPASALIDDGEDGNNQVLVQDGRSGYIYTYADEEGTTVEPLSGSKGGVFTMTSGGANGSKYAAHMKGTTASAEIVYAGMGFNLTDPKDVYDAGKYGGVAFYAKKGPGSTSKVVFKMPDAYTDPDGKVCGACYNDFSTQLKLTEEWQRYTVLFDTLRQEPGWGSPRPSGLAVEKVYAIQFHVKEKGAPFDIWVDDLQFTGCP